MILMLLGHWIKVGLLHEQHMFYETSYYNFLLFLLCTPVQIFGGRHFYYKSYKILKAGALDMNVLIALSTTIAYVYSIALLVSMEVFMWEVCPMTFFDVPVMLLMFVSLGKWLENIAKQNTAEALTKLMSLKVKESVLVSLGEKNQILKECVINTDLVQAGDVLKVRNLRQII
ncbi:unnamed protein product [Soboliphyme baturini]|uniref:Cation_ATPase_C domain-containing protein n=1 Tax=Soboliphyme baturini TaxID=241478 RepID=A0A183JAV4_9BILA|nr:unnamed protein product [Soboliphyme baturini]